MAPIKEKMAAPSGDVAIVGMSCRFPGDGEGVDGFWQSISSGQCKYFPDMLTWKKREESLYK